MAKNSQSLFHYTKGGIEVLKSILKTGFRISYCLEINPISFSGPDCGTGISVPTMVTHEFMPDIHYYYLPMVSFCDIPIGRISDHIKTYGAPNIGEFQNKIKSDKIAYGIGMKIDWALKHQLNPVAYFAYNSLLARTIFRYYQPAPVNKENSDHYKVAVSSTFDVNGYVVDNKSNRIPSIYLFSKAAQHSPQYGIINKYKEEQEWRYIPEDLKIISQVGPRYSSNLYRNYHTSNYMNARQALEELKNSNPYTNLTFDFDDISYIIVGFEEEKPLLMEHLNNIYFKDSAKQNSENEHKKHLLFSKIFSYESIVNDFNY